MNISSAEIKKKFGPHFILFFRTLRKSGRSEITLDMYHLHVMKGFLMKFQVDNSMDIIPGVDFGWSAIKIVDSQNFPYMSC